MILSEEWQPWKTGWLDAPSEASDKCDALERRWAAKLRAGEDAPQWAAPLTGDDHPEDRNDV